jgi:homoserine kinase type II
MPGLAQQGDAVPAALPSAAELARFFSEYDRAGDARAWVRGVGCAETVLDNAAAPLSVLFFDAESGDAATYVCGLLGQLSGVGIACPRPIAARAGGLIQPLGAGAGLLLETPTGERRDAAGVEEVRSLGALLGRLHASAAEYPGKRRPLRGPRLWRELAERIEPSLDASDRSLLRDELRFQGLYRFADLPRGPVHGDPGPTRVVFAPQGAAAFSGFGEACNDVLLLDLARAANAWCSFDRVHLDGERLRALLAGYHAERPLRAIERGAWPVVVRAAALDAWLWALEVGADAGDPEDLRSSLATRREDELPLQVAWV